ncbi:MAG: BamA/TamA family outer membrane protein [Bacteroidia bacterium]
MKKFKSVLNIPYGKYCSPIRIMFRPTRLVCLLIYFLPLFLNAQIQDTIKKQSTNERVTLNQNKNSTEQKDALDLVKNLFHSRKKIENDSSKLKFHKVLLVFLPGFGYTVQTNVTIVASANISFYTDTAHTNNLSTISSDIEYSPAYRQIIVPIIFNSWNRNNTVNLSLDCRYMKVPTFTYGLGGNTSLSNAFKVDYSYVKISVIPYIAIRSNLYAAIGYNLDYHWRIKSNGDSSDFTNYSRGEHFSSSSGFSLSLKYDSRINSNNPQGGLYFVIALRDNFLFLGSSEKWKSIIIDTRKYIRIKSTRYQLLAFWSYNVFSFGGKVPYFDLPNNGSDSYALTGRGYRPGRFRGNRLLYAEMEYRFGITSNGLFGGVAFANAETISEWPTNHFTTISPAAGVGLRVKVNKYSNVNYAIDYGVGLKGSRGFFIHLCEVF